ncbi:MAG: hypothetical protein SPJ92_08120 [Bariatricus sp.]|nr:hypothetical protein [Bariatricus sp.]
MEKDVYWKNHQYHLPLLEAGKYENRQYVLPLSCIYYVYLGEESREFQGETLSEWMEELESEKNLLWAEKILFGTMELICVRWQQPSLEYEHQKVMFEPEIWENFFKQYYPVYQKVTKDIWEHYGEEEVFGELNWIPGVNLEWAKNGESFICQTVPNLEGRRMASVQAYGAVGMGSEYKKEAYEFLMLFLDGGEEQDNKKEFWKNGAARGVPVQESSWKYFFDANQVYDEKAQEEFMKSFRELDGSFFVNTADRNLYWKANDIIVKNLFAEDENLLLNDKIERLVQEAKEQYEMIVME